MGGRNLWAFTVPSACMAVPGWVQSAKEVEDWWFLCLGILQDYGNMHMK